MTYFNPIETAGYLPLMLEPRDPRSPQEQLNETYAHGGGWHSFKGFTLVFGDPCRLLYPEDPPRLEVSRAYFREKLLVLFQSDWLAVIEADGTFDVARID